MRLTEAEEAFVFRYGHVHSLSSEGVLRTALRWLSIIHDVPGVRAAVEEALHVYHVDRIGPKLREAAQEGAGDAGGGG
jgi:hypothetical protein